MNFLSKILFKLRFLIWARLKVNHYSSFYLSHSQFGEDMVLRSLTEGVKKGFYIDIGAHHPVYFSNTYHFYCKGWRGINIDANPNSMELFNVLRPGDINLEACLGLESGQTVEFFIFEQSALNTCDPTMAESAIQSGAKLIQKRVLRTKTLEEILEQFLPDSTQIDVLCIDIEGLDEMILMSHNWSRYQPKFILFEKHNFSLYEIDQSLTLKALRKQGYEIIAKCGPSLIVALQPR